MVASDWLPTCVFSGLYLEFFLALYHTFPIIMQFASELWLVLTWSYDQSSVSCFGRLWPQPRSCQVTVPDPHRVVAADQPQWIHSRPKTDCRHQGWAIKDFSALSKMRSTSKQPLYDITSMILHVNKSCVLIIDQNLQIFLKSFLKKS